MEIKLQSLLGCADITHSFVDAGSNNIFVSEIYLEQNGSIIDWVNFSSHAYLGTIILRCHE